MEALENHCSSQSAARAGRAAGSGLAAATHAAPVKTEHVEAELVSERTALVPGKPITLALRLKMAEGWHTYWRNPGDSGLPTTITWKLPDGVGVGAIQWPAPRALPTGPLVNYGYEGEVLLLTGLTVPRDAAVGSTYKLAARADWLVCKDVCIPEGADLDISLPVSDRSDPYPQWGSAIAAARAALPTPLQGWQVSARGDGAKVALTLTPPAGAADPGPLQFFPHDEGRIEPSGKQVVTRDASGAYALTLPAAIQLAPDFKRVAGVVTAGKGFVEDGERVAAVTIDVPLVGAVTAGAKPSSTAAPTADLATPVRRRHGVRAFPRGGRAARLRRRPDPEPDALRVPGAVAEGAAPGPGSRETPRAAAAGDRLRGRRDRYVRGAGRPAADPARRGRAARVGLPAAVAAGGHRPRRAVLRARAESFRRVRVRVARSVVGWRLDGQEPLRRLACFPACSRW